MNQRTRIYGYTEHRDTGIHRTQGYNNYKDTEHLHTEIQGTWRTYIYIIYKCIGTQGYTKHGDTDNAGNTEIQRTKRTRIHRTQG